MGRVTRTGRSGSALGVAAEELRRHNLATVLEHLHLDGPSTRSQLTSITGLNRSTVADLIGELTELGLVGEEPGVAVSGPGRPSPVVHLRPEGAVVLAVEVGDVEIAEVGHVPVHRRRVAVVVSAVALGAQCKGGEANVNDYQGKLNVGWLAYRSTAIVIRAPQPGAKSTTKCASSTDVDCPSMVTEVISCSAYAPAWTMHRRTMRVPFIYWSKISSKNV